jgi:uncharacterized protein with FMN-binding domain
MFPKRGAVAAALTMVLVAFLLANPGPSSSSGAPSVLAAPASGPPSLAAVVGTSVSGGASATPFTRRHRRSSGGVATAAPSAAPTAASTRNGSSGSKFTGSVDGTVEQTQFGPMQVQVVYSTGKIVDVVTLQMTNFGGRSNEISQYATPILKSEALAAQSANIDSVSGATYTSEGYIASLQSAIDARP